MFLPLTLGVVVNSGWFVRRPGLAPIVPRFTPDCMSRMVWLLAAGVKGTDAGLLVLAAVQ
jgi:hypothetical protein